MEHRLIARSGAQRFDKRLRMIPMTDHTRFVPASIKFGIDNTALYSNGYQFKFIKYGPNRLSFRSLFFIFGRPWG